MTPLDRATPLAALGEFALLAELLPGLPTTPDVRLGPGDDAAVVAMTGSLVVSTDLLIERVDFRRDWSTAEQVGRKCVAVNVSDIEAMGARPTALVIGFGAPGDTEVGWVRDLMAGAAAECQRAGVALVGGDISSARDITLGVTAFGDTDGRPVVTRSGARPGDVVAVRGRLGWAAAGLAALGRGFRSPRAVVDAQRVPEPEYGAGRQAAAAGATAMIDVSDGLVADLGHLARASGVAIDVRSAALDVAEPLRTVGTALGTDPLDYVLGGGEDCALAATFPAAPPEGWTVIGAVLAADAPGVTVDGAAASPRGWDHFGR